MRYEGIAFNEKFASKLKEQEFVKHNQHLWPNITDEQRTKRLKEVHKLVKINENNKPS